MELLRKQNERMNKQVSDLLAENRSLVEPLKQARADVAEYKRQLENYQKDKLSLAVNISKILTFNISYYILNSRTQKRSSSQFKMN